MAGLTALASAYSQRSVLGAIECSGKSPDEPGRRRQYFVVMTLLDRS
jgi:hypothetical protein